MTPLADALRLSASSPEALSATAIRAGVARQAALARAGKPIAAGAYLALCAAAGIDPVDGKCRPVKCVSSNVMLWWLLSAALYITRGLQQVDQRSAAKAIGVSPSTICRASKPASR